MSGTNSTGGAGGGMDIAAMQAMQQRAEEQQQAMFMMSTQANMDNTAISTWGNLAEEAAKNKPQV